MLKVAVLVSGGGSNLQSILDYGQDSFKVEMVIGSKDGIYGLERAKNAGIPIHVVSRKEYGNETSNKILELTKGKVDLIVLAGYLSILDGEILKEFKDKIINIHPSLIPSFCGDKMYGMHVHNAVRKSGVKFTGCTVHFVNEEVDGGSIILQEVVPVYFKDTAEDIQKRVLVEEHKLLPRAIDLFSRGKIEIIDGRVNILK
ncbi:phosphoribosylglycinamide formyltransferase [Clostridium celatum]|uniref:Phosphoribosylglycinamide formyltransferase n=1 Tax=Clostridium celatum DSM 1785 TaxID=545697 RepID=L1QF79_9CLOT|nr:phosphoribosylglycinamide formyltransferase [Clostridium celatum]EKY26242.1 phosphoribosylglycinamide formyltransferase [Clostridium celatum DSM 1785]MCE9654028.1 phosphoribosylglycinamide formyltransferase [Clostridium celatum]MDU2265024.1 phosphoribosylglycinamide formyltransferase [Clostridium celatum]MDU3724617.1 phosphoribosylglycinamide formyltransferase [Clostridium celatum]MDU6294298.1 phosphoribosylglycinamide formyltransferase [Clostridium celatum]